jgi:hypothetical protein
MKTDGNCTDSWKGTITDAVFAGLNAYGENIRKILADL